MREADEARQLTPATESALKPKSFRVPTLPPHWQQFGACVLLHLMFPLLPIGVERLFTGRVLESTFWLITSTYALTIGASSRGVLMFVVGVVLAVVYAVLFGWSMTGASVAQTLGDKTWIALWGAIVVVFVLHTIERYNRHVADRAPFLSFLERRSQ